MKALASWHPDSRTEASCVLPRRYVVVVRRGMEHASPPCAARSKPGVRGGMCARPRGIIQARLAAVANDAMLGGLGRCPADQATLAAWCCSWRFTPGNVQPILSADRRSEAARCPHQH
eukprot:358897-Chlamydomonas_euryale.AAC.6